MDFPASLKTPQTLSVRHQSQLPNTGPRCALSLSGLCAAHIFHFSLCESVCGLLWAGTPPRNLCVRCRPCRWHVSDSKGVLQQIGPFVPSVIELSRLNVWEETRRGWWRRRRSRWVVSDLAVCLLWHTTAPAQRRKVIPAFFTSSCTCHRPAQITALGLCGSPQPVPLPTNYSSGVQLIHLTPLSLRGCVGW